MQFHIDHPHHDPIIRRISTIRLQTMKHIRGNCMRNCWASRDTLPRNLARNSIGQSFNRVRKRCNSNDLNSVFETVAGELRAKLLSGGGAWPSDQRTADVTNVVKPMQLKSPHEDPCDKRRQSKPKNHHYQRKSPQIDDVCNNGSEIHTKNTLD